jgi:hypothetical protein
VAEKFIIALVHIILTMFTSVIFRAVTDERANSICAIALVVAVILIQALIHILVTTSTSVILRTCAGVVTITVSACASIAPIIIQTLIHVTSTILTSVIVSAYAVVATKKVLTSGLVLT